ncbi:MAG: Mth938-like domain-containing protein [Pseudomonadota bacterium]
MDVTPLVREGQQIVQSYAGGQFQISGQFFDAPIIVTPEETNPWDIKNDFSSLSEKDFDTLLNYTAEYDVFLLGCGSDMAFLPKDLKNTLRSKGLSFDVMDTGAACRTYNVLMAEGRRVVAAMFPA